MPGAMTPVPADMLALPGERVEFEGRAGRLGGYLCAPVTAPGTPAVQVALPPPLLLLHSMNAAGCAAEMRPVYEHARRTRPVLAIDLPGFGISERSHRAYTPRLMTDAVLDALDFLRARYGDEPVDLLGLSLSSEFAARAAVEAPQRVRRLALVSPTGFNGSKRRYGLAAGSVGPPWLVKVFQGPGFDRGGGWGAALFSWLTRPGVIRYFLQRTWGRQQIDEALWRYDLVTTRQSGAHYAPLYFLGAALFSTDVNTLYEQLRLPVWMSHGTRGDFTDYRGTDTIKGRDNWRVSVYKDCGALMYFEQPAQFCADLDQFLG